MPVLTHLGPQCVISGPVRTFSSPICSTCPSSCPVSLLGLLMGFLTRKYDTTTIILLFLGNQIAALSQMSWLMKTAAIELRVTSLNRQRSHTQRLVNLLLDDHPVTQHTGSGCVNLRVDFSMCKLTSHRTFFLSNSFLADGESGMEEETRSVSGFLHFDSLSKGLCPFRITFKQMIKQHSGVKWHLFCLYSA